MEPLSAAASIIAVVGAARKAAEGLQSLKAIKDAPKELEDLLLEFSQIEVILQSYKNLPTDFQERSSDLITILGVAENKFDELDSLVHYTLTKAGSNEKVDRFQWLQKRSDTERLRKQLGQILVTLNTLLNTTSFTTLQEISSMTNEVLNEQKRTQSQVLATQLELVRLLDHVRQAELAYFSGERNLLLKNDDGPTSQLINPRPRVASDHERKLRKGQNPRICQRYCRCNCHKTLQFSTPLTLRNCIGFGSLQISGRDSLQRCNIKGCKQSVSSRLRLDYILPRWFALRMLSTWYNSAPLYGPELLLRVPVVLPWPKLEFGFAPQYWQLMNEHIDHWLHTPSHIDEQGKTLLFWATFCDRCDVISHLLDMGLHLREPTTGIGKSAYDMLWEFWASPSGTFKETQKAEAVSNVDWDEYIEDGGLTELHLIVSGLRYQDLETYIRAHPEELEQHDALGHGPLWYASIFGELADIRTLLKYGVILNEDTFQFSSFISKFGVKAFDFMNEHLSPSVLKSLCKHECAREWFLAASSQRPDVDEVLAIDKLCLEHGFDVNYSGYGDGKTLLMAIMNLSLRYVPLRVKQLLDHGANLESTDVYGRTALHHCIEAYGNGDISLKLLNMLIEHGARLDHRTKDGTTILHALILNFAQLEPIEIILHSDTSSLLLDARDDNGYTAFDLLLLRARLFRQGLRDRSVSLEAGPIVGDVWCLEEYVGVGIIRKWMRRPKELDMERKILTAFEALLHHIQEVQGIPPEEQYPSVESVLDQEEIDAEASRLEGLPGSWLE